MSNHLYRSELNLIDKLHRHFNTLSFNTDILVGIGDDCAVINSPFKSLAVCTDTMHEGIDFDLSWITAEALGYKLITINVSDIFAMKAKPLYALLNLSLRKEQTTHFFDDLISGISEALQRYGISLIGGDLSSARADTVLSATIIGEVTNAVLRSGANVGDKIYVTGTLGDSACGLYLLMHKACNFLDTKLINDYIYLINRHCKPTARDTQAIDCSSMIDISDGLSIDLHRLCSASGVGALIYKEQIPLSSAILRLCNALGLDPYEFALSGGEDYEMLFTTSKPLPSGLPFKVTCIGEITASDVIIVSEGKPSRLMLKGYEHFA